MCGVCRTQRAASVLFIFSNRVGFTSNRVGFTSGHRKYTLDRPQSLGLARDPLPRASTLCLSNSSAATRGGDEHSAASLSMVARNSAGVERAAPPSSPVGGSPTLWSSKRLAGLRSGQVHFSTHTRWWGKGQASPSRPHV